MDFASLPKLAPIQTPCNKTCTIDGESGLCLGCFRTMDEVATWAVMSADQRRDIMRTLRAREERIAPDKRIARFHF